jgi:hypothetical protein
LKGFDGLLVRKGERLLDDLLHRTVRVRTRRIHPGEERLEEGALARRTSGSQRQKLSWERKSASERAYVLTSTRLRTSSGWRSASSCAIALPIEKPATWAEGTASARRTAAASSAIITTESGRSGIAVRPAPRLSKAIKR